MIRKNRIVILLSDEEKAKLSRAAGDTPISAYVRKRLIGDAVPSPVAPAQDERVADDDAFTEEPVVAERY